MKVQNGRQIKRRLIIFSAYVYTSDSILGEHALRAIQFWGFWPNFLAYITPVLPLTEALADIQSATAEIRPEKKKGR